MKALIITDVQNDFCPGGALTAPEGDQVAPVINRIQPLFDLVVATQDWHPANHGSFAVNHPGKEPGDVIDLAGLPQILWPVHCVQDTPGAELHPALDRARIARVFRKGVDPQVDSYSGFFDNGRRHATGLADYLHAQGVEDVYLAGLTIEYCVLSTALDAVMLGFRTHVVQDACRGLEIQPGNVQRAIEQMFSADVRLVDSDELRARGEGREVRGEG